MAPVHDILIIGGGGAGLRAAIAAAEINPQLDIALVSKVYPMRSHTVAAEGGTAAVIRENDSLEDHINDTITGSDWMADQDAVELFVNEATAELIQLEHWGVPLEPRARRQYCRTPVWRDADRADLVCCRQDRFPPASRVVPNVP